MSLINQVLLDLDRRHAPAGVPPLARGVAPPPRAARWPRWAAALVAVTAGAGIVAATSRATPTTPSPRLPSAVAASSVASVAAVAAVAPVVTLAPAVALAPPVALAPARPVAPAAPAIDARPLEVVDAAAPVVVPMPSAPIASAPAPKAAATVVAMLTAPALSRRGAGTPALVAPLGAVPEASVEKRDRPLSGRERADAEYQRGIGLHQQGQADAAREAFAAALRDDARHGPARQALAVALLAAGRGDEAETVLAQGLELQPRDATLAATLARIKVDHLDLAGAIAVLKAALPVQAGSRADSADARALLATLQQRNGEHAEAIENYAAALRLVPGNGPWWIGLGVSLSALGRGDNARDAFERARAGELTPELARYVEQRLAASPR